MQYIEKETVGILNIHKFINPWLWNRYSVSAYQGCEFGCIYCYAREDKYNRHFGDSNTVFIKRDSAKKLDRRIARSRTLLPDIVGMSGVCDPYQPVEKTQKATRACLEVLAKHHWPVMINTKSALVVRDLDIIGQIARDTWASVVFSVTTSDPGVAGFLEPRADPPKMRFEAIAAIRAADSNIKTGVAVIPLIPGIEDTDENLRSLVEEAGRNGADFVIFSPGVTMAGTQAVLFQEKLFGKHPELESYYEDLYKFRYSKDAYKGTYGPKKSYQVRMNRKMLTLLGEHNIPPRIRRFIPDDFRKTSYLIAEKLCNQAYDLQAAGKAWTQRYWAGMNIQNLKESVEAIAARGELRKIRNVDETIEKIILDSLIT